MGLDNPTQLPCLAVRSLQRRGGLRYRYAAFSSAASIRTSEDFQEVAVRILEIKALAAIVVVDFTRLRLRGVSPVGKTFLANPSKNLVELGLAD